MVCFTCTEPLPVWSNPSSQWHRCHDIRNTLDLHELTTCVDDKSTAVIMVVSVTSNLASNRVLIDMCMFSLLFAMLSSLVQHCCKEWLWTQISLLSLRIFLEDTPDKVKEIFGIVSELTPPPPARSPFTSTPKTMSSLRSRKSPSKGSLFVNTIVANRDTDERVFEADSLDNSPGKSGFQMPRKSKTSRERKIVCNDIRLFRDEDHEVRALGGPLLQAPINVSSACELEEISKPTSTATKHIRQASIYSHANSDISVDSGVSTETVRPRDFQHNSSSTVIATHAHTSTTEEAKKVMTARSRKPQSSDGDQQQSSLEVLPSPYVMDKNGNGNGQMYFGPAKNSDTSTELEGATLTNTSSFESSACNSPLITSISVSPTACIQPTSPSSTYSYGVMKIPRKTVGSGSSKSTSDSTDPLDNSLVGSPLNSFNSTWSSGAHSVSLSSESEDLSQEEVRRRHMRHAAYDAYKVPSNLIRTMSGSR